MMSRILSVGVPDTTLRLLASPFIVDTANSLEYAEDIEEFLKQGIYDALMVDFDNSPIKASFVLSLRKNRITIPILGIGGVGDTSWQSHRANFLEWGVTTYSWHQQIPER